jgi:hypothetical protein
MGAESIRCQNDRKLFDSLLVNADVKRVNELIAKRNEEGPMSVRRHLLATSVRLSRWLSNSIHAVAEDAGSLKKRQVLYDLAETLNIPSTFIDQTLDASVELD